MRDQAKKPGAVRVQAAAGRGPSAYEQARAIRTLLPSAGTAAGSYVAGGGIAGGGSLPVVSPGALALGACTFGPSAVKGSRFCGGVRHAVIAVEDTVARHVPGASAAIAAQTAAIGYAEGVATDAYHVGGNAVAAVAGGIESGANAVGSGIETGADAVGSAATTVFHALTPW